MPLRFWVKFCCSLSSEGSETLILDRSVVFIHKWKDISDIALVPEAFRGECGSRTAPEFVDGICLYLGNFTSRFEASGEARIQLNS